MNVSKVSVRIWKTDNGSTVGFADVELDKEFAVHFIRICRNSKDGRLFLNFPSQKTQYGYVDIAHPLSKQLRESITTAVLECYRQKKKKGDQPQRQRKNKLPVDVESNPSNTTKSFDGKDGVANSECGRMRKNHSEEPDGILRMAECYNR